MNDFLEAHACRLKVHLRPKMHAKVTALATYAKLAYASVPLYLTFTENNLSHLQCATIDLQTIDSDHCLKIPSNYAKER